MQTSENLNVALTPLCIDLDGTLLRSDTLLEGLLRMLSVSSRNLWQLPRTLLAGRSRLKRFVAEQVVLELSSLPVRPEVLQLAENARAAGHSVVLVTAADESIAQAALACYPVFNDARGSDGKINLKGRAKAEYLVARFGSGGFDYVGDSHADLPVWRVARRGYAVGPDAERLARRAAPAKVEVVLGSSSERSRLTAWWTALRPHQWTKNVLVLMPLLTSGQLTDPRAVLAALSALVAFCLTASGTYVINDLLDVQTDRLHPEKRHRPIPRGDVPLREGLVGGPLLVFAGCVLAAQEGLALGVTLVTYAVATLAYSVRLKSSVLTDVILLAGFYVLRVLAGSLAVDSVLSLWLFSFTLFAFFSFGLAKRYVETRRHGAELAHESSRRGYRASDANAILALGAASAVASVTILALYINDDEAARPYPAPELLWLILPAVLYWVSRVWIVATREEMQSDPISWALRDRLSLVTGGAVIAIYLVARYVTLP